MMLYDHDPDPSGDRRSAIFAVLCMLVLALVVAVVVISTGDLS